MERCVVACSHYKAPVTRIRVPIDMLLDRVDARRHRNDPPGAVLDAHLVSRPSSSGPRSADVRRTQPFEREVALRAFGHSVTIEGRSYPYVLLPGTGDALCVNYSAFFGEWGDRRTTRSEFQGWFHRLRMFWPLAEHHILFLCDTAGADSNGAYYKGVNGDFFVERAMAKIQSDVAAQLQIPPERTVTVGSSMGATAALRFALRLGYAGAVVVGPHIDLDTSALLQGRLRHVAAIVGRPDVEAPELRPTMREISDLVSRTHPLPRLVMHSMLDDHGVHDEQVVPFVAKYREAGGAVCLDYRTTGGHTTKHATVDFYQRAIAWCLNRVGDSAAA